MALALVALLAACAGALADTPSPIAQELRASGVYVSPRVLGEAAPAARAELVAAREELAAQRRDVAMAIVPGPAGSRTLQAYARRLRAEADLSGPLLVAAPGRAMAATGAAEPARAAAGLDGADVDAIANPVERLIAAAWIVSVPEPEPDGTRELLILLVLAALGAAWAIAWGANRTDRQRRDRLSERRTHVRLGLDALRAHATAVTHDGAAGARAHRAAEEVLALCSDTLAGLHEARTESDIVALVPRIRSGFDTLAAAQEPGRPSPCADDPFAGLCGVDPAHGRATTTAAVAGLDGTVPVCARCARRGDDETPLHPRMVPSGRRALPFPAARGCLAPPTADAADAGLNA